ncbi:hypothetical protein [Bacillus mycoides]|uniref:Uncharacterized protein n=1 Tax=Bacillus mycoides TaxID=1405 RepID=A0AAP8KS12_BACMY|nr:hypothetical protein [Bacillus mycoides]PJN50713.1 hypothetical protein BAWEI_61660 [Bacillus mycoides]PJN64530.1 hypothetical protein BACWE_50960 [Bacillus mycoides]
MNHETNIYRVCEQFGAPLPPNDTPNTPPHNPVDLQNMCKSIGRWTYFWTNSTIGNFWVYVTLIGIEGSPIGPFNTILGCLKNGRQGIILPLNQITDYEIR